MNRKVVKFSEDLELEILVRDDSGEFGLGSTTHSQCDEYNFYTDMYQNRIDLTLTSDDKIRENLGEGKNYNSETNTLLEAINSILHFWCLSSISTPSEIGVFSSIKEALEYFKTITEEFMIFKIE